MRYDNHFPGFNRCIIVIIVPTKHDSPGLLSVFNTERFFFKGISTHSCICFSNTGDPWGESGICCIKQYASRFFQILSMQAALAVFAKLGR